jgi:glyoxylase-like metal-dependent hydrolase (beta-lactamase superfamily II)
LNFAVETFVNGKLKQNCHLVGAPDGSALIIDPGSDAGSIRELLNNRTWRPQAILNTHAHYDHVGAVADLMEHYEIPFYLHGLDAKLLSHANLYRVIFDGLDVVRVPEISYVLKDLPYSLEIAPFEIELMHTPGHTPGSVCFKLSEYLFCGDTLMASGAGRTDLPGGDPAALTKSLELLSQLNPKTQIYGGHGPSVAISSALSAAALQPNDVV